MTRQNRARGTVKSSSVIISLLLRSADKEGEGDDKANHCIIKLMD